MRGKINSLLLFIRLFEELEFLNVEKVSKNGDFDGENIHRIQSPFCQSRLLQAFLTFWHQKCTPPSCLCLWMFTFHFSVLKRQTNLFSQTFFIFSPLFVQPVSVVSVSASVTFQTPKSLSVLGRLLWPRLCMAQSNFVKF